MGRRVVRRRVTRMRVGAPARDAEDRLASEEPLEIRIGGRPISVTMRTPGHDVELAAGFLVSEGVVRDRRDLASARYCAGAIADDVNTYNVLDVTLGAHATLPEFGIERSVYTTSSCGVCGKASIDAVRTQSAFDPSVDAVTLTAERLARLPGRLRQAQEVFALTGGLHAAGLFDATSGLPLVVREDVGRHNAVDKVIGWALEHERLPLAETVLLVSGRASFELVQKAAMAGIPVLAAVSAPSSLAAELAEEVGVTLVGFLRDDSMVVYTRPDRIIA